MQQSPKKELRYPFLNIINEKEAIVMGINPTNNYQHVLLRKIRELSTIQNATKGLLFQINEVVLEQLKINLENAISSINRLILNKLIAHLVCFQWDIEKKVLYTRSFFVANPPELSRVSIADIHDQLIRYSFDELKIWYEERQDMDSDNFKYELEVQYNAKKGGNFSAVLNNVFNPYKLLRSIKHEVKLSDELVGQLGAELSKRLQEANMAVQIPGHGLLVLRENEVLDHFELAAQFFLETILPPNKVDSIFKYKLDKVSLEEKSYFMAENYPIETCRFTVMKAKELQSLKKEEARNRGRDDYPGSLAVETVINLEHLAEKKYQEIWQEEQDRTREEFKKGLTNYNSNWTKLVRFVSQEEAFNYGPELWKDLLADKDLFYMSWEGTENTYHIFTSSEEQVVNAIVLGITAFPPRDRWKVAALQNLVQEKQLQLKSLFSNRNFVHAFHRLQKKVYIDYLPWYKRLLVLFSFFEEKMFNDASKKLEAEQKHFSNHNKAKKQEILERIQYERTVKIAEIKENALGHSIEDTLDVFYLTQKKIPNVHEIKDFYPDMEINNFLQTLKDYGFKLFSPESKEFPETSIVLYPASRSWKDKKLKLKKIFQKQQDSFKNSYKFTPDPSQVDRVQKLLTYLEKK
ncbi:MAG: hypothetical protein AAF518_25390 [Spirochaetota bacterium]